MHKKASLDPLDYVLVVLILLISLGIGVLFAVKDFRNNNRVEYLLGGRRMLMLPVALSVFATFTSAVALIGMVTDMYMYGAMVAVSYIGFGSSFVLAMLSIVPLMYPLKLTSIYEYLELRFHSSVLRKIAVVIGMLQTLCYMSVVMLSPALALQTAAGFPMWVTVGVVGFIGTVYTAIGGIKSVIWTDAFQSLVMLGGLLAIILKGVAIVGGADTLWNIVTAGDRAIINNFSLDPRVRNTWWGGTIGTGPDFCVASLCDTETDTADFSQHFYGLAGICGQSSLVRISAMRSLKDAKIAFFITGILNVLFGVLLLSVGWVVYAYFIQIRCDPYKAGFVTNPNQISPYFVMYGMRDLPGVAGVYMAMIFSASLSTISSGISALAANTVEDLLEKPLKNVQEKTVTSIIKVFVFLYGIIIVGLTFLANSVKLPLSQISGIAAGGMGGPILGIFLLGALFPLANKYGALIGGSISVIFNLWIALGSQIYKAFEKPLPFPPTDMCFLNNSILAFKNHTNSIDYFQHETVSILNHSGILKPNVEEGPRKFVFFLYDISYVWYGLIGVLNSLILGMIISYCTRKYCVSLTDEKLLIPLVQRFWLTRMSGVKHGSHDEDVNGTPMLVSCNREENIPDEKRMKKEDNRNTEI